MQKQISQFLSQNGHDVLGIASDGEEGFTAVKEHRPELVTLDITMPNRNGKECLKDIMTENPSAKVMIISAIKDQSMILECMDLGAKAFVPKPLKFKDPDYCEEFLDAIQEAQED